MAIVTTYYKEHKERAIGLTEASSGVGLLLGPFFGALLYEIGGYMLPFVATGKISQMHIINLCSFTLLLLVPTNSLHFSHYFRG